MRKPWETKEWRGLPNVVALLGIVLLVLVSPSSAMSILSNKKIPRIDQWTISPKDGSLTGIVTGHPVLSDGDEITTSPISDPEAASKGKGTIVTTLSGTKYKLETPKKKRGPLSFFTGKKSEETPLLPSVPKAPIQRTKQNIRKNGGIPVIDNWKIDPSSGRLTGIVTGHPVLPDGDFISASPPLETNFQQGSIITTETGSTYKLKTPKRGVSSLPFRKPTPPSPEVTQEEIDEQLAKLEQNNINVLGAVAAVGVAGVVGLNVVNEPNGNPKFDITTPQNTIHRVAKRKEVASSSVVRSNSDDVHKREEEQAEKEKAAEKLRIERLQKEEAEKLERQQKKEREAALAERARIEKQRQLEAEAEKVRVAKAEAEKARLERLQHQKELERQRFLEEQETAKKAIEKARLEREEQRARREEYLQQRREKMEFRLEAAETAKKEAELRVAANEKAKAELRERRQELESLWDQRRQKQQEQAKEQQAKELLAKQEEAKQENPLDFIVKKGLASKESRDEKAAAETSKAMKEIEDISIRAKQLEERRKADEQFSVWKTIQSGVAGIATAGVTGAAGLVTSFELRRRLRDAVNDTLIPSDTDLVSGDEFGIKVSKTAGEPKPPTTKPPPKKVLASNITDKLKFVDEIDDLLAEVETVLAEVDGKTKKTSISTVMTQDALPTFPVYFSKSDESQGEDSFRKVGEEHFHSESSSIEPKGKMDSSGPLVGEDEDCESQSDPNTFESGNKNETMKAPMPTQSEGAEEDAQLLTPEDRLRELERLEAEMENVSVEVGDEIELSQIITIDDTVIEEDVMVAISEDAVLRDEARIRCDGGRIKATEETRVQAEEKARIKTKEEARLQAEEEARIKAEEEARLQAEEEAKIKAKEEARLQAEEEAKIKAKEEARLQAEEEAKIKAKEEARLQAEEEAKIKAKEEARLQAEEEARIKAEEEARLQAEEEAKIKAKEEARLQAEEEAKIKAKEEARLQEEEEASIKAKAEARLQAEEEARIKAEEEARLQAEEEAKIKAKEEARLQAEEEARIKAEEEARLQAEEEAKIKAEEEARLQAEEETKIKAKEEARLQAEEEARIKAEEDVRLQAEEEAKIRAEEEARLRAEEEARRQAEEEARIRAEEEARLRAEDEAKLLAEEEVRIKAEMRIKTEEEIERRQVELEKARDYDSEFEPVRRKLLEARLKMQYRDAAKERERAESERLAHELTVIEERKKKMENEQAALFAERKNHEFRLEKARRKLLAERLKEQKLAFDVEMEKKVMKFEREVESSHREMLGSRLKIQKRNADLAKKTRIDQYNRLLERTREKMMKSRLVREVFVRMKERKRRAEEEARIKAEQKAAAKAKAEEEARIKAEQKVAAKAKAEEEANVAIAKANEAVAKAKKEAENQAAKAKAEEQARMKAEEEAAKANAKAAEEAANARFQEEARIRAEEEAAAATRAREEAKLLMKLELEAAAAKAKAEAEEEARMKFEQEAAIAKAKAKTEEEARIKLEKEAAVAKAKAEADEKARIKLEEEAIAARKTADAEHKAKVEAEKKAAAAIAKAKAEEEARIKLEKETADAQAKVEAREEARIKLEAEAAISKAKEEEEIQIKEKATTKAEEEARLKAEEEARVEAQREEEKAKAEAEATRQMEEEAAAREEEARERAKEDAAAKMALLSLTQSKEETRMSELERLEREFGLNGSPALMETDESASTLPGSGEYQTESYDVGLDSPTQEYSLNADALKKKYDSIAKEQSEVATRLQGLEMNGEQDAKRTESAVQSSAGDLQFLQEITKNGSKESEKPSYQDRFEDLAAQQAADKATKSDKLYSPTDKALANTTLLMKEVTGPSLENYNPREGYYSERDVLVRSGNTLSVPVRISTPGTIVEFSIKKKAYDFGFGISAFLEDGTVAKIKEMAPFRKKLETEKILVPAGSAPCTMQFKFTNNYSGLLEKVRLGYNIRVIPPSTETIQLGRRRRATAALDNLEARLSSQRKLLARSQIVVTELEREVTELQQLINDKNKKLESILIEEEHLQKVLESTIDTDQSTKKTSNQGKVHNSMKYFNDFT